MPLNFGHLFNIFFSLFFFMRYIRIENGDNCSKEGAPLLQPPRKLVTKCGCTIRLESCQETIRTISIFSSSPPTRTITRNLCRGKVALHHTNIDHSTRFSHKLLINHAQKNKTSHIASSVKSQSYYI
jgi:hypothetical protein